MWQIARAGAILRSNGARCDSRLFGFNHLISRFFSPFSCGWHEA
jgi:hypothetical protein